MNTPCPHCRAEIEIDADTHAALAGHSHFDCPACQGPVPVPVLANPRLHLPSTPAIRARTPSATPRASAAASQAHKGNRNLLVLGTATLLVLGGIGLFLANKNSGDSHLTTQNISNDIINNTYFQNLINNGATTVKDLQVIAEIKPYGDGFIGISQELLSWKQAQELAKRTGADVLAVKDNATGTRLELLKWLAESFSAHLSSSVWVREFGDARILDGPELLAVTAMDRQRKVLLNWQPVQSSGKRIPADALAFDGSRYAYFPGTVTWEEARATAETMGGHLAAITSAEEDAWVVRNYQDKISGPRQFWIGGIQEEPYRPWRWVTGEPFAFTQWTTGEPNNAKAPGPKSRPPYMLAYLIQGGRMGWNDLSESDPPWRTVMIGYLVEWDD